VEINHVQFSRRWVRLFSSPRLHPDLQRRILKQATDFDSDDGSSNLSWNVAHLPDCTAQHSRTRPCSYSSLWERNEIL